MLLVSTVIIKAISAVYKIPLTAYIGATGRGYFSVAYNLCLPIHALTMGAFPIALSKLVSTYNVKGDALKIKALKKASGKLFSLVGVAGFLIMLIAAKPYANAISSSPKSIYTILMLAPSVLFSCLCACKRALAEGYLDMKPTAVSQIIEALFKMVFGLLFARYSMSALYNGYIENGRVLWMTAQDEGEALAQIYPLTSACAMAGVTLGSIAGWIFSAVYVNSRYNSFSSGKPDIKSAMSELVLFSLPLAVATAVQSVGNFFDTASIQYALSLCDKNVLREIYYNAGDDVITYVFGIYSSALDFKNLVPSVVMALGVTAVPAVSAAYESSNERFSLLITSILKYTSILASLGGLILALFSKDMLDIFYLKSNPDIAASAEKIVFYFGVTVLPCCLASTAVFCAQSLGYSKNIIVPFVLSALVRVGLNLLLVSDSEINVTAGVFSSFAGYLLIAVWSIAVIVKKTNCHISLIEILVKPIICMATVFFTVSYVRERLSDGFAYFAELLISLSFCVTLSAILLLLFGCISKKDLKSFK